MSLWPHPSLIPMGSFIQFGASGAQFKEQDKEWILYPAYLPALTSCSQFQCFLSPPFKSKLLEAEKVMGVPICKNVSLEVLPVSTVLTKGESAAEAKSTGKKMEKSNS